MALQSAHGDESLRGIGFMLLASCAFAIMGVAAKTLGRTLSSIEVVLWRNAFGTLWILLSFWKRPPVQRGGRPLLLIARGLYGTLALYGVFYNVSTIHLGTATTFPQIAPLLIAVIAHIWLGERLPRPAWVALGLGLLGVMLILRPSPDLPLKNSIIGLCAAGGTALAYVSLRQLGNYYETRTIVLSFSLTGLIAPALSLLLGAAIDAPGYDFLVARYQGPEARDWLWLLLLSVCALIGQTYVTKAYATARAGVVSAIGYSGVLLSLALGVWLGDGWPDAGALVGMTLILASGVLVSLSRDVATRSTAADPPTSPRRPSAPPDPVCARRDAFHAE